MPDYATALWAYALSGEVGAIQVAGVRAEALLTPGSRPQPLPSRLLDDEGRCLLATVLVVHRDDQPRFVERVGLHRFDARGEFAHGPIDAPDRFLLEVARQVSRRAGAPEKHAPLWAGLFRHDDRRTVADMARATNVTVAAVVEQFGPLISERPEAYALFDLHEGVWRRGDDVFTLTAPLSGHNDSDA